MSLIGKIIKKRVVRFVNEHYPTGNGVAVYPSSGGKFPYEIEGGFLATPEDIKPERDYVQNFESFSSNEEVYEFPKDEFFLGLRIERDKLPDDNILDIAEKVILKLQDNPNFYSDLK